MIHEKNDTRFVELKHPGYSKEDWKKSSQEGHGRVGVDFAAHLQGHLACITDGLILNYTVAKMFEIPSTGCLLLVNSEMVPYLKDLGYRAWAHYIPYTEQSLDNIVDVVLDPNNRKQINKIRAQGQALVWSRHLTSHRAQALHTIATERFQQRQHICKK